MVRRIAFDGNFSAAVRSFVTRAKSDSGGAKLKMLQRSNADDIVIIYLSDVLPSKVIYKAERLSIGSAGTSRAANSSIVTPPGVTLAFTKPVGLSGYFALFNACPGLLLLPMPAPLSELAHALRDYSHDRHRLTSIVKGQIGWPFRAHGWIPLTQIDAHIYRNRPPAGQAGA